MIPHTVPSTAPSARQHAPCACLRTLRPGDPLYPPSALQWREWCEGEALFADPAPLTCIGDPASLSRPTLGLVCSAHCPGTILLDTYRFIRSLPASGPTVVGGFHSPMERNCLETLLARQVSIVYCPGRRLGSRSVPLAWRDALDGGRLLLLSPFGERQRRVDRDLARQRNGFVGALAETLFVPYARQGGAAFSLVRAALQRGKRVITLADPENDPVIRLGVEGYEPEALIGMYSNSG